MRGALGKVPSQYHPWYSTKSRALQAEGGSGAPEAGEGAGGAPLGGGSEDGAGVLLPLAAGVVRETGGERSVGLA